MRYLKKDTAFTFRIGPLLDSSDGVTAETGLSIAQADIQISKNGGAFAQTSDASPTTTHDTDGWYQCPLTATDTDTLGPLTVQIVMAGALPVWEHFTVVPAHVYDGLVAGTDNLQVDTVQISGTAQTANDVGQDVDDILVDTGTTLDGKIDTVDANVDAILVDTAEIGAAGAGLTEAGGDGDHLTEAGGTGDQLTAVPWNAAWDAEVQSEATDALNAYDPPTNAELEARTILAAAYFDPATDEVDADVVKISGDATAADRLESLMDGLIVGQVNDVSATTTAFVADGFTEATNDHFNGRLITFITGALAGQQTDITDYVGSTQTFTVTALTEAPANDDFFVVH